MVLKRDQGLLQPTHNQRLKMTIHLNTAHRETPYHRLDTSNMMAPEVIGDLFQRLKEILNTEPSEIRELQISSHLEKLGVDQSDKSARDLLIPLLEKCFKKNIEIVADSAIDNTGIYYLREKSEPFAVVQIHQGFLGAKAIIPTFIFQIDRSNPDFTDLEALQKIAHMMSFFFQTEISVQEDPNHPHKFTFASKESLAAILKIDDSSTTINLTLTSKDLGIIGRLQEADFRKFQSAQGNKVLLEEDEKNKLQFTLSENKSFAVFKIGVKRTRIELLVRHIAHRLGLERHAIPGIFCTIVPPNRKPTEQELIDAAKMSIEDHLVLPVPEFTPKDHPDIVLSEELYNGLQKVYLPGSHEDNEGLERPYTITGILEPYLFEEDAPMTPKDFLYTTLTALAIGLRDGKEDGIIRKMLTDTEECMPSYLDPEENDTDEAIAATHLPFLESKFAHIEILSDELRELATLVSRWNPFQMFQDLTKQRLLFVDLPSEDTELGQQGWDHGGCPIQIAPLEGKVDVVDVRKNILLTERQINACIERMTRLKAFILQAKNLGNSCTAVKLTGAMDPYWAAHYEAYGRIDACYSPAGFAGYVSPTVLRRSYSGGSAGDNSPEPSPPVLSNIPAFSAFKAMPEGKSDD